MSPGIGMPATLKLQHFGRVIHEFFGEYPYHVGSSLKCTLGRAETWRDVDVRLILPDDEFDRLFGELTRPRCLNLKWNAACLAFAALGRDIWTLEGEMEGHREEWLIRGIVGELYPCKPDIFEATYEPVDSEGGE